MAFKKGHKKKGGRTKGAPNKATSKVREYVSAILDDQGDKLREELATLQGAQYVNAITGLLEFSVPKLQRTELSGPDGDAIKVQTYILPDGTEIEF